MTYKSLGKLEKAKSTQLECLDMMSAVYGLDNVSNPEFVEVIRDTRDILESLGELEAAELLCGKCLDLSRTFSGNDVNNPATADALFDMGNVYLSRVIWLMQKRSYSNVSKLDAPCTRMPSIILG